MYQCKKCDVHSFRLTHSNEHDEDIYDDGHGNITRVWPERPHYVPPAPVRDDPDWVVRLESKSAQAYRDLISIYRAYDNQLCKLTAMGIRTLFEDSASEHGAMPSLNFRAKLDSLQANGKLTQNEREDLDVLVLSGNAATHRSWDPNKEDLDLLLPILENYIYRVYLEADDKSERDEAERTRKFRLQLMKKRLPGDNRKTTK